MKKINLICLVVTLFLGAATGAWGFITSAVDMDPSTAGVQTSLTVTEGDVFSVDVVLYGEGGSVNHISAVLLDLFYNGNTTGDGWIHLGPSGSAIAGNMADNIGAIDYWSTPSFPVYVDSGDVLSRNSFVFPPLEDYASDIRPCGLKHDYLSTLFSVGPESDPGVVFSFDFTAGTPGTSNLVATTTGGWPAVEIGGVADLVDPRTSSITINAVSPPTAEAGLDQIVFDEVTLDGSMSEDTDGTIELYEWNLQNRGNGAHDRKAYGEFATVSDLEPGFYDVILTVEDNDGETGTDEMECVAIGIKGDLDFDGDVDAGDLAEFAEAFGAPF